MMAGMNGAKRATRRKVPRLSRSADSGPDFSCRVQCEASHTRHAASALLKRQDWQNAKAQLMKMRRMLSWWFRIVVSGRFLERFLRVRER
jgi:hypothetical protein